MPGTVQSVLESGDIRVRYPSGHVWTMNPDVVVKVGAKHKLFHNNFICVVHRQRALELEMW